MAIIKTVMNKKQVKEILKSCHTDFCKKYWSEQLALFNVSNCDAIFEKAPKLTIEEIEEDCRNIPN